MASSQVEIASSSPFGFVLRDHSRRDRCSRKNFKGFVHRLSGQPRNASPDSNKNSDNDHINPADLWVHIPTYTLNESNHAKKYTSEKWARGRKMVSSGDAKSQNRGWSAPVSPFQRENSPDQSESSVEISNLGGVSSLVRKWRDFEAEAKSSNANTSNNSPVCASRSNLGSSFLENASVETSQKGSDAAYHESLDGRYETSSMNEDSFGDHESNRTASSGPPSRGRDSDTTEKDRLRVVDIIKKLSSSNEDNNDRKHAVGNESSLHVRISLDQSSEQKPFSPVLGSPRVRGRQACRGLLMQTERDRHLELKGLVERKAVSRFAQRGHIQAMLRAQCLRGAAEAKDVHRLNHISSESNRVTQSSIKRIRERFRTGSQQISIESKNPHKEVVGKTSQVEKPSISNQSRKDNHQEEVTKSMRSLKEVEVDIESLSCKSNRDEEDISHDETKKAVVHCSFQASSSQNVHQDASPRLDVTEQRAIHNTDSVGDEQLSETSYNSTAEGVNPSDDLEEDSNNQSLIENDHGWVSDVSHTQVGWEELHSDYEQEAETCQDWITDISRPRSEWEGLRQERYQEMLDPFRENEEIRQLLQRKSVSSFLSSNLRERIDRLMTSRTQQQPHAMGSQEDEELAAGEEEEGSAAGNEEREEDREEGDEEEENECNVGFDDDYEEDESEDYADQTTSSLPSTSWSHNDSPDVSDDSDQVASPTFQQNTSPNSYSLERQPCSSFTNHSSIEMEFIYELRGYMKQLRQEISELRKSVKSCVNMQRKLKHSVKQEVAAALGQAGERKGRHSTQNKGPSRGICFICNEVQVDSLLYRCGHMCTCFKCAQEVQWNSGRCPICQAPIIDVVRAYAHSSSTEMDDSLICRTS